MVAAWGEVLKPQSGRRRFCSGSWGWESGASYGILVALLPGLETTELDQGLSNLSVYTSSNDGWVSGIDNPALTFSGTPALKSPWRDRALVAHCANNCSSVHPALVSSLACLTYTVVSLDCLPDKLLVPGVGLQGCF